MNIGILGTGMVGEALGTKFVELGHKVCMGSRTANNENAAKWTSRNGAKASQGTFADAAAFGEIVFVCLRGDVTLEVIRTVGQKILRGKIVVDLSNPLDFSQGMPPSLLICNTNSLAEEVQKALPESKVVKTLNIVNCEIMVNPLKTGGEPTMLVSGNDREAKATITGLLKSLGWTDVLDLGDIKTARGTEMLLPLWLTLFGTLGNPHFAFKVLKP